MRKLPIAAIFLALLAGAGLFLAYEVAGTLLLVFSGILLAAVLDAATRLLQRLLPWGRLPCLAIVSVFGVALLIAALVWGGLSLTAQIKSLIGVVSKQAEVIAEWLYGLGFIQPDEDGSTSLGNLLPTAEQLFGHAQTAFGLTTGLLANVVIIVFLGLFFALDPASYRDGFVRLLPVARRRRVSAVLDETGHTLRWWLLGQLACMAITAVSIGVMLYLVGMPNALLLGVISGLLNFIPFLGPILAAIPVALAAMPEGLGMLLLVMSLFTILQSIEGYFINPLIQKRAVYLPPAWSLAALVIFGALFGALGIALATPALAVARVLVLRLYVEDGLEGGAQPAVALAGASDNRLETPPP